MISVYRLLEVALYSLLNFLPFLSLALYAFRRHMHFSFAITNIMVVFMCALQIGIGFVAAFSSLDSGTISVVSTAIYAGFLFLVIKYKVGTVLFVLLTLSNVGNLVAVFSKCLEGIIFGDIATEPYRWSLCICMLILHLFITIPVGFYIRKYFTSTTPIQTTCWNYLWIVPATFYLTWYYHLYFTGTNDLTTALSIHNALFLLLINIGAFAVYHIAILLLFAQKKAEKLAQENQILQMSRFQHENLKQRINEVRKAKHDVHHHALLIREYLRNGKLQELDAYLDNYIKSLPGTQSLVYCQHYVTNTLLNYYAQQAQNANIKMDILVQLPETLHLPESSLSVILGNLLENALDACQNTQSAEKKITVRGKYNMGAVYFEVSNPFFGTLRKDSTGEYLTTKTHGHGLGLHSVSHLVQIQGGMMELNTDNGIFRVSLLLPEDKPPFTK